MTNKTKAAIEEAANTYRISSCTESAGQNSRRAWNKCGTRTTLSAAIRLAKSKSKSPDVYESEVLGYDSIGELIHHSYYRNGRLEIDMSI